MIRKAINKDIKAIYSLILEGVASGKVLKRSMKELKRVVKNFVVYEEDGKIVGCCSLEIYNQKLAEVRSLVVNTKYRNKRIGTALVQRCLDQAKEKDIYQVLSVTDKCDLFKRLGFKTEINKKHAMFLNF